MNSQILSLNQAVAAAVPWYLPWMNRDDLREMSEAITGEFEVRDNACSATLVEEFEQQNDNVRLVTSLGTQRYFSLMREAAAMVGNSSSGIIEAASFQLPVVNIGLRQSGRPRSENIIDVDSTTAAIRNGIQQALSPQFRELSQRSQNIYGDGTAGRIIADRLATVELDQEPLMKRFYDASPKSPVNAAA